MGKASFITGDIFTSHDADRTLAAWRPYSLCVGVLSNLQNSDIEPRWGHWQVQWVGGLALLRAVGHVLKKVDSDRDPLLADVIHRRWQEWSFDRETNWIFWEFIEKDRNTILKLFDFGFKVTPYLEPDEYEVEEVVYDKMQDFREAVYWWRHQLRSIEGRDHQSAEPVAKRPGGV